MIGTIDDPCSDLKWHKLIAEDISANNALRYFNI